MQLFPGQHYDWTLPRKVELPHNLMAISELDSDGSIHASFAAMKYEVSNEQYLTFLNHPLVNFWRKTEPQLPALAPRQHYASSKSLWRRKSNSFVLEHVVSGEGIQPRAPGTNLSARAVDKYTAWRRQGWPCMAFANQGRMAPNGLRPRW